MSEQQKQDVEILEIVLRNKQHAKVNADYEFGAIRRLLNHVKELEQKRDAALKLAQSWLNALYSLPSDSPGKPYTGTAYRKCANEIRAIFEPKEGK